MDNDIKEFLSSKAFAVVGASQDRNKFGNKVLRCYLQHNMKVYAVNPKETKVECVVCYPDISNLPVDVKSLSIITPPVITEKIVEAAIKHRIQNIWMQPGAESREAVKLCKQHGINVIADGRCILVELGWTE